MYPAIRPTKEIPPVKEITPQFATEETVLRYAQEMLDTPILFETTTKKRYAVTVMQLVKLFQCSRIILRTAKSKKIEKMGPFVRPFIPYEKLFPCQPGWNVERYNYMMDTKHRGSDHHIKTKCFGPEVEAFRDFHDNWCCDMTEIMQTFKEMLVGAHHFSYGLLKFPELINIRSELFLDLFFGASNRFGSDKNGKIYTYFGISAMVRFHGLKYDQVIIAIKCSGIDYFKVKEFEYKKLVYSPWVRLTTPPVYTCRSIQGEISHVKSLLEVRTSGDPIVKKEEVLKLANEYRKSKGKPIYTSKKPLHGNLIQHLEVYYGKAGDLEFQNEYINAKLRVIEELPPLPELVPIRKRTLRPIYDSIEYVIDKDGKKTLTVPKNNVRRRAKQPRGAVKRFVHIFGV